MKKLLAIGALASVMILNVGCEPEEIAAGAVGVAIGIGIADGGSYHPAPHRPHPPGYRPAPPPHRPPGYRPAPPPHRPPPPGYGRPNRPGYGHGYGRHDDRPGYGYNNPGHMRPRSAVATMSTSKDTVQNFAIRHGIRYEQATKISNAFKGASSSGMSSFSAIGLNEKDVKNIVRRKLPAQESLAVVANKLDLSQAQARDLVKEMIADFDAEASNVNSYYWKSCMAKGKWKTQLTTYCSSTITEGCSPKTGALYCYQ